MKSLITGSELKRSDKVLLVMMASALGCVVISLLFGALGAFYYVPAISARMVRAGVSLVQLRPLHTTFASSWIFLGAATGVYRYLFDTFGEPTAKDMRRFRIHMVLWGIAGLGVMVTLPFGVTTGREYLGFHPFFSLLIAAGWCLFAWTFFAKVRHDFFSRPVYVYMWGTGILFFLWTFAEGHAYLLPWVERYPVADLQIQWKSCGTIVAAFNQMVYGTLTYLGVRGSGDKRLGHSRIAFALFGVGLLNSFTNYAHHTYHLPQSHLIKWVAFSVSMLEIILLVLLFREVATAMRSKRRMYQRGGGTFELFVGLSKRWNSFLLTLALLISIPPLNALIHGTHVVMAHAMASEIAIDSYILLGAFSFMLATIFPKREIQERFIDNGVIRDHILRLNLALGGLVATLLAVGLTTGVQRYLDRPMPAWLDGFPYALLLFGCGVAYFLLRVIWTWLPLFLRPAEFRSWAAHGVNEPDARNPITGQPLPTDYT